MDLRSFTLYDVFRRNARVFKNRVAIRSDEGALTFGELHDRVQAVAGWLASRGIGRGDRIAVLTKNSPEFFPLLGGIAALGAVMVPINFRLTAEEILHVLTDTSPELFFYETDYESMAPALVAGCQSIRETAVFGEPSGTAIPFAALLKHPPLEAAVAEDGDPLVIIHTAAIEGKPRGAVLTHRNLVACAIHAATTVGLTFEDAYLDILPLFHIAGLMAGLTMMQAGGTNVIIAKYDPRLAGALIDREKVTFIGNFPPILNQLLDAQAAGACTLASLRHVLGVESAETIARFEGLGAGRFWLAYGQTETTGLTCICAKAERPGSAGRPGPLVDMMIADDEGREVAAGQPGEILVRGPLVFAGFWGEEELTRRTLRGGWHHTGDIGRLDEEGFLFFVGRKAEKELIKTGGENVYPAEVEKAVLEHAAVAEVAVIGVPDPKFGEGIKAVCVLKPGGRLSAQELIDFVAARIARYKKPGSVQFVETLPKKGDGAIDRPKVKELYGAAC